MTNPQSHDTVFAMLLAALAALLGPLLGQVVLILGCSFIGALIALSRAKTQTLMHGVLVLGRGMGVAMLVGGAGSILWSRMLGDGWGYPESLAIVSALVGLRTEWALARISALTGGNE